MKTLIQTACRLVLTAIEAACFTGAIVAVARTVLGVTGPATLIVLGGVTFTAVLIAADLALCCEDE